METPENNTTKTSRAEIVLKSATLPRRKTAKTDIQLDTTPKVHINYHNCRFSFYLIALIIHRINHHQCDFKRKCNTSSRICEVHPSMNIQLHIVHFRYKIGQQVLNLNKRLLFLFNDQDSLANNHQATPSGEYSKLLL